MAADFDILVNTVRARLPSALDGVVRLELQNVLKEFLNESNAYVDELTISVVAGTQSYQIDSFNGAINRLMALADSDNRPVACELVPPTTTSPFYSVKLRDKPSSATTLTAYIALTPDPSSRPEDSVPDWLISKYREGFEDGVLARMMLQPAKPYSNLKLAEYHGRKYRRAVSQARNEALHAFKFRGQGWIYPRNFFGRRNARI